MTFFSFSCNLISFSLGKRLKIKCDEVKPVCQNCVKYKATCDYSLKLSWGGRPYKKPRLDPLSSGTAPITEDDGLDDPTIKTEDGLEVPKTMGSMKTSFKDISKVFKPTPLQKLVRPMSFVIEDPSIHYTTPSSQPESSTSSSASAQIQPNSSHLDPFGYLGLDSPHSAFPSPDRNDSQQQQPANNKSPPVFDIAREATDLLEFHIKNECTSPAQPLEQVYQHDEPIHSFNFLDDPALAEFDLSDFTKDFEVSESLNTTGHMSYHAALMQVPARNQISSYHSHFNPHSIEEITDENIEILSIPRSLEFLPDILRQVPMYRDLFHHFIYVSADMLVPAPILYPENPFKTILPPMALGTPHLLALVLAFAASHRARFLRLPEPVDVISRLLSRVFQGLTTCLENEQEAISDTTLTTAIMLSTFEILTESVDASWKKHLHGARDIVVARGLAQPLLAYNEEDMSTPSSRSTSFSDINLRGAHSIHEIIAGIAPKAISVFENDDESNIIGPKPLGLLRNDLEETDISYFLIRWFAYIEVIGALSSSRASAFLTTNENMAQLWAIHDWSIARIKERGIEGVLNSKVAGDLMSSSVSASASASASASPNNQDPHMNFPVKIDFMLGMDLDMLPVFSKVTYLVRHRQRLNKKKAKKEQQNLTPEQLAEWQEEYRRWDEELSSEAFEVSDLIISFCEAYELRRKQYVNNALGQIMATSVRRDSLSSLSSEGSVDLPGGSSPESNRLNQQPAGSLQPFSHTMLPLRVQTYSHLCAMNTTFCYSAVIQLYRRVLELPSASDLVQGIVKHITEILDSTIPQGSPVESCMSFPIFTTACEVQDPAEREKYWLRMKGMERFGVGQVHKARKAMELTWQRNVPWEDVMEENGWDFVLA